MKAGRILKTTVDKRARRLQKTIRSFRGSLFAFRMLTSWRRFTFCGQKYDYFINAYNRTWRNERAVEIPIVWQRMQESQGERTLEVGNVLSHYYPVGHQVVDKYEDSAGVANVDIVDFIPDEKFARIVSISTLEHVGFDEEQRDPLKVMKAVEHLRGLLAPGGEMILTLPLGYNPSLDRMLDEGELKFDEQHYLIRVSWNNRWREASWSEVRNTRHNEPYPYANALIIAVDRADSLPSSA